MPMQTQCGHLMCFACVQTLLEYVDFLYCYALILLAAKNATIGPLAGIEPAAPSFPVQRSNQLSYRGKTIPIFTHCATGRPGATVTLQTERDAYQTRFDYLNLKIEY